MLNAILNINEKGNLTIGGVDTVEIAKEYGAMSCVECGTCSYNCPGNIHIVQHIRVAKGVIRADQQRVKAANEANTTK